MRGQTCFCQHYGIFRAATGGLLTPRTPVAHLAATSSARCLAFLTLERAHTRPYTILRQAVKSPSNAGRLRSSTTRLRGTFPLGLPEFIRQTALPSVRGPHLRSAATPQVLLVNNVEYKQLRYFLPWQQDKKIPANAFGIAG